MELAFSQTLQGNAGSLGTKQVSSSMLVLESDSALEPRAAEAGTVMLSLVKS